METIIQDLMVFLQANSQQTLICGLLFVIAIMAFRR